MNKVLLIGRLVRNPEANSTSSGIKYARFTIAVDRQFADGQTDFIPIVAWRNQAEFVEKYMRKGALISVEGRFTSSNYQGADNQKIFRYEVTADRVEGLETKKQVEARQNESIVDNKFIQFEAEKDEKVMRVEDTVEVPWDLDL